MLTFCTAAQGMIHQRLGALVPGWNEVADDALAAEYEAQSRPGVKRYLFDAPPGAALIERAAPTADDTPRFTRGRRRSAEPETEAAHTGDASAPTEGE